MTSARRSGTAWHPDGGSLLAVPGTENDVSMFERLSWSVAFSLKGPHSAPINLVSFSPNGKLAAALCKLLVAQMLVFDFELKGPFKCGLCFHWSAGHLYCVSCSLDTAAQLPATLPFSLNPSPACSVMGR